VFIDQRVRDGAATAKMSQAERVVAVDQHSALVATFRHPGTPGEPHSNKGRTARRT